MLTTKQRAYLRSLAQTEEAIFQIGKGGATRELVEALSDALEKRELIKISVLQNCEDDVKYLADVVSTRTHAELVQTIGKKIILYRTSKKPHIILPR